MNKPSRAPAAFERIPAAEARALIHGALKSGSRPLAFEIDSFKRAPFKLIRSLPSWVGRAGFLAEGGRFLLWCEPHPRPGETFPGQFVLDIPPGRYFVEIYETGASAWLSRESAEGGPLVAGLPHSGDPIVVWVRPFP